MTVRTRTVPGVGSGRGRGPGRPRIGIDCTFTAPRPETPTAFAIRAGPPRRRGVRGGKSASVDFRSAGAGKPSLTRGAGMIRVPRFHPESCCPALRASLRPTAHPVPRARSRASRAHGRPRGIRRRETAR